LEIVGNPFGLPFFVIPRYYPVVVLLDGKKLSQKIREGLNREIAALRQKLRLAAVVAGRDPVVEKFIEQKKKTAAEIGIDVRVYPFPDTITTNELRKRLAEIVHEKRNTGVIVQLPLPPQINTQYILNAVVPEKDSDMLSAKSLGNLVVGKSPILPPVAGAVKELFQEYGIDYRNKYIAVAGAGNLVGRPVALWLLGEKATFSIVESAAENAREILGQADIVISGIGRPQWITGEMVKKGATVIDAGTSESAGKVIGDVDFDSAAARAAYLTPVPGGIGPLAITMLFKNLVILAGRK
jgi:methylenetetrahydrofolate dehydrogenase (NADP+)/methenyltetrahydrofolate cyclohydrolase